MSTSGTPKTGVHIDTGDRLITGITYQFQLPTISLKLHITPPVQDTATINLLHALTDDRPITISKNKSNHVCFANFANTGFNELVTQES
jgi:hypothetical protein